MKITQHVSKEPAGYWRNQKGNQKISRNKWQWKYDNSKPMGCSKSSSKREAIQSYLKKQEKHQIDNLTLHLKLEKEEEQQKKQN